MRLINRGSDAPPPHDLTGQLQALNELGLRGLKAAQTGENDSVSRIQQLLGNMRMPSGGMGMPGSGGTFQGFARGGYPMHYSPLMQGLPVRSFARGGRDFVNDDGQGNGRSDHIPAKLSPGEFVMDAETTSMLGDGDSEAGARKLEQLRQAIRRHKGHALAKGRFSPNAKPAQDYLPKGALS